MSLFRKIWAVASIAIRSNLAYLGEVVSRTIFLAIILYVFLKLWQATYAESGNARLGGLTLAEMLWYLTITEAITLSAPKLAQQVDEDIRTGTLVVRLTKPLSYPLYCLATSLGERFVNFLINIIVGAVVASIFVGLPKLVAGSLPMFALATIVAFILDGLANLLIGLGAFWLEDTSGLVLLYSRLRMILGGMLIPLQLFPGWLQTIVFILPFSSLVYGPAHMFVRPDTMELCLLLMRQMVAFLVLGGITWFVYKQALNRVSANGG